MINSIPLQTLRNGEFLQFITDALGIVALNSPKKLLIEDQYKLLLTTNTALESLYKIDRSNPVTEEITALDTRRDNAVNGISSLVNAYTYHFNGSLNGHANILLNNLNLYGAGIARDNYMSETATINGILNDWKTRPELQTAIKALQLAPWLAELEAANTEFNTKYLARTQELGAASPDTLKLKRVAVANAYYEMRDYLNSYFTINKGETPFAKATNELNALIAQYNTLLVNRNNKATGIAEPAKA